MRRITAIQPDKISYIFIEGIRIPYNSLFYTVDKKTFEVKERISDGANNVSYEYYFKTKKEASHAADCLLLRKLLSNAVCIESIRNETNLFRRIHAFTGEAFEKIHGYTEQLLKEADGKFIYEKHLTS